MTIRIIKYLSNLQRISICILTFVFFMTFVASAQHCDTLKKKDFFQKAEIFERRMQTRDSFSVGELLQVVKIYNSMFISELAVSNGYQHLIASYKKLFRTTYMKSTLARLNCVWGKGDALYSRKYDLYVGIGTALRCKDIYKVL
jgi:hypothetical protein